MEASDTVRDTRERGGTALIHRDLLLSDRLRRSVMIELLDGSLTPRKFADKFGQMLNPVMRVLRFLESARLAEWTNRDDVRAFLQGDGVYELT